MLTVLGFLLLLVLFWLFFLRCRRIINTILNWMLCEVVKKAFPKEDLDIQVDDFGYFCVKGVHINYKKNPIIRISQVLLQFVWDESIFGLKLQSTVTNLIIERCNEKSKCENKYSRRCDEDTVEIKGSITLGINLFSLSSPTELLKIAPETEYVNGSEINTAGLKSLWLFARNGEASIWKKSKENAHRDVFYKLSVSEGDALVLHNSKMARLVVLFKKGDVTCSPSVEETTTVSKLQIASSDGLILMYKFVDGVLTSSHSRLQHTEVDLTPSAINTLETLVGEYVGQNMDQSLHEEDVSEAPCEKAVDNEKSCENNTNKTEVAFEAESITANVYSSKKSNRFKMKLAVVGLGSSEKNMTKWSISIPFELMFLNAGTEVKEPVLGSKVKSDGMVNPFVLKAEGEESSDNESKWDVSFHAGILVQIKPNFVNELESFVKAYRRATSKPQVDQDFRETHSVDETQAGTNRVKRAQVLSNSKRGIFKISGSVDEIVIDVLNARGHNLFQITMQSSQLSVSQDLETRSLNFMIGLLKAFNCLENIPFFHPTEDKGEAIDASLELSVVEEMSNDTNKLSFKKFTFGSCNTTVVVEETLLFAVLKDFGFHKKAAEIFFQSRGEENLEKPDFSYQRFYFDHLELQAVEIILTLLPAIDLPVELKVIKNSLGIPHQLPPRFENACLNFDAFLRNHIQYGSYKYISNDIKKHYLKELGSQSARVLGSMHLLGNISRLKQDIITGFTTLRETGEFITFFRQVTTGVASSYSKFTGSWSDLFGMTSSTSYVHESSTLHERRHSDPSELDVAALHHVSGEGSSTFQVTSPPAKRSKDDSSLLKDVEDSEGIWLKSSVLGDAASKTDGLNWDTESNDGEGGFKVPLSLIPRNVKRQLKGQEFLRRLKENLADNEHGEIFVICYKVRKNDVETKLNALLSNRKVYFLKGRPNYESLVLCVKYETLYKAQYALQDQTHYLQLISKMKGTRTLSVPSRNASECPLVRCDNMTIARKVAFKINELKKAFDHERIHTQHL